VPYPLRKDFAPKHMDTKSTNKETQPLKGESAMKI